MESIDMCLCVTIVFCSGNFITKHSPCHREMILDSSLTLSRNFVVTSSTTVIWFCKNLFSLKYINCFLLTLLKERAVFLPHAFNRNNPFKPLHLAPIKMHHKRVLINITLYLLCLRSQNIGVLWRKTMKNVEETLKSLLIFQIINPPR